MYMCPLIVCLIINSNTADVVDGKRQCRGSTGPYVRENLSRMTHSECASSPISTEH